MSFGKDPHVAKAESAEQKAREARDELARAQAVQRAEATIARPELGQSLLSTRPKAKDRLLN